eukprot:358977-Chlamydomonas_euryale.AAC.2
MEAAGAHSQAGQQISGQQIPLFVCRMIVANASTCTDLLQYLASRHTTPYLYRKDWLCESALRKPASLMTPPLRIHWVWILCMKCVIRFRVGGTRAVPTCLSLHKYTHVLEAASGVKSAALAAAKPAEKCALGGVLPADTVGRSPSSTLNRVDPKGLDRRVWTSDTSDGSNPVRTV